MEALQFIKELGTYDPERCTISMTFANPVLGALTHVANGFAEKSKIKVSRNEANYKPKVGMDGHVVRQKSNNKSGSVEIHLLRQVSSTVDFFTALLIADELDNSGIFQMNINDGNSQDGWACINCYVEKLADEEVNQDADEVTYKIFVTQLEKIPRTGLPTPTTLV